MLYEVITGVVIMYPGEQFDHFGAGTIIGAVVDRARDNDELPHGEVGLRCFV